MLKLLEFFSAFQLKSPPTTFNNQNLTFRSRRWRVEVLRFPLRHHWHSWAVAGRLVHRIPRPLLVMRVLKVLIIHKLWAGVVVVAVWRPLDRTGRGPPLVLRLYASSWARIVHSVCIEVAWRSLRACRRVPLNRFVNFSFNGRRRRKFNSHSDYCTFYAVGSRPTCLSLKVSKTAEKSNQIQERNVIERSEMAQQNKHKVSNRTNKGFNFDICNHVIDLA